MYLILSIKVVIAQEIPIIVIAPSKTNQSYSSVGTSVNSLSGSEIQETGKFFLGEVLNDSLPGMNYFRSGGLGTVSGIQLRGLPKRYSTVYIDGVKMSDPSSSDNSFYFSNIMTSSIEKVEILKGSNSSIYGSGAIGGVINIYTKKGRSKESTINLNRGSNGIYNIDLSVGDNYGNHYYYIGMNNFNTDGISAMNDEKTTNDDDSYDSRSLIANYSYEFSNNNSLNSSIRYSDSFLNYDEVTSGRTDANNSTDDDEISYNISFSSKKNKSNHIISYNYTGIERATKNYLNDSKNYYGYRDSFNYIGNYNFDLDTKIVFGLENEFDRAKFQKDWPTDYLESDEAIYSQFLDLQFRPLENLYSTFGLRRDDHTTAGAHNTGRITLAYKLDKNSKLRSSYGTGLRYPTLYDYFYGTTITKKEDLSPEKSKSFDLGYETKLNKINTDFILSLYRITYEDALEGWASNGWKIKNTTAEIESKGIEIEGVYNRSNNFSFSLNYNYTDTYDGADCDDPNVGSGSCIDESMVRVPRHSSKINFNLKTKNNFKNLLSLKYNSEIRDYGNANNSFKDVILDEYLEADYNLKYVLSNNGILYLDVNNIFNNNYEPAFMYSSMGRNINIGFRKKY